MAFSVRKTSSLEWTPFCTKCGSSIPRDQWWFTNVQVYERGQRVYHCILCRFNASVHLATVINMAIDVYAEMCLTEEQFPIYSKCFRIAEKIVESYYAKG